MKKDTKWEWTELCQRTFDDIKVALASEPILKLPNFDVSFEMLTDALDRTIGGVLVEGGYPIAYKS